ncbi:MAG: hypothetical protein PHQ76_03685 [Caldisericia bacterium]|nr:hypothetical protein [Caldisericia bacterium]MDD5689364.1 hypothetical protein [Caldisericia bacterium]
MENIIALCDYKGIFGSKYDAKPYRSGMDKDILAKEFSKYGYKIKYITFADINNREIPKGQIVIYTSSEDPEYKYKEFIEDVVYYLEICGVNVIPSFKYLRANNNKVFMELLRKIELSPEYQIDTKVFSCLEEALSGDLEYPLVIKSSKGACGSGVYLVHNKDELIKYIKMVADTKNLKNDFREIVRVHKYKGYIKNSYYREKFIIQKFISNLKNDWKVYVFWDKMFVFYRPVLKKRIFKASGGGYDNYKYGENANVPVGLFNFALEAREQLNVPNVSLDIAYDGLKFHLLEYQCVYFGTAGIARSNYYFIGEKDNWISYHNDETTESVYAYSIAKYIKHTQT